MSSTRFRDRREAGQALAARLRALGYGQRPAVMVLALPRGGVPIAYEVATTLHAPLDVFVVRKLGSPGNEELAMGAIASGGIRVLNSDVIAMLGISPAEVERAVSVQEAELERRAEAYRGSRPPLRLAGQTVILVDDGLATGASMRAAIAAAHQARVARVVVAVPVAANETCRAMQREVDEMVCLMTPMFFQAVGQWYEEFSQTSDEEVHDLLVRAALPPPESPGLPHRVSGNHA